jgi:uncharacterized protein
MLTVTFLRDSRKRLSRIFADGHAEAGNYGEDLVCAGASAILQAAWLGLASYAKIDLDVKHGDGQLDIRWPIATRDRADVQAIVATAHLAIEALADQFPLNVRCTEADEP